MKIDTAKANDWIAQGRQAHRAWSPACIKVAESQPAPVEAAPAEAAEA